MFLGFTAPLIVLGAVEVVIALLLLAPIPLARPAIALCKRSKTPVGYTVLTTLSLVLGALLASPLYELYTFRDIKDRGTVRDVSQRRQDELAALLSAVLTGATLLMLFVLRKLGGVLAERENMKLSQQALLKQVQGLNAEYNRLSREQSGATARADAEVEVAKLRAALDAAKKDKQQAEAQLQEAQATRKAAVANAEALKSQSKGLENEYDRLLAEHDRLKRRLAQVDPGSAATGRPGIKKDD